MAITVKHKFVSAIPDGTDATIVRPSNWNDDHDLVGTVPVANGGTGVTTSSGANSVVLRDANVNINANAFNDGYTNTAASGTPIVLTVSSVRRYTITGSGGQTIKLPDATTLVNGEIFEFDNNQSSGAITVNNNSNTLVVSVPSGGLVRVNLLSNSIAAGSWDRHDYSPANVSWSTNTFDYAGSITSATWNGNTVAVNRGGTGVTTSTGSGSNVLNTSPTLTTPAITGGTIDNTVIGGTTPAAGTFTTITGQTEVLKGTGQNLFVQSQTFTNGVWSGSTATRADNQTTAPDGTTTAGTFTSVNTTFGGLLRQYITLTSTTYMLSVYVKKNNYRYVGLRFGSVVSGNLFAFFDFDTLATNTVGISGATLTATDAGSGWYRLALTGANTTLGSTVVDISTVASDGSCQTNLGAGQIVNVWGAQLEIGSVANTYIPTTTTAIYGTPTLSFSGVAGLGLQSDGSLYASSAGTGNVRFYTNNVALEQMRVSNTTSAVDYVQVTGATTASKVVAISAQGSDTDVTLSLAPKGAGTIRFGTYTAGILTPAGYITITDSGGTSRRLLIG